jgi:hypothetical protein
VFNVRVLPHARRLLYTVGWAVLTVLAGTAVWWGLRPLLAATEPVAKPVPSTAAPAPGASAIPATAPSSGPPVAGKPKPPAPSASSYDGWAYANGVFTRVFDVAGGSATIRIIDGRVELVDKAARDGYTVIVEQPQPERLVVRFYKPDAPYTVIDAMWWLGHPYATITT